MTFMEVLKQFGYFWSIRNCFTWGIFNAEDVQDQRGVMIVNVK